MRTLSTALIISSAIFLFGCDPIYGVSRHADLENVPIFSCVESAVHDISEIGDLKHTVSSGSRPLTLSGLKEADEVHTFQYFTFGVYGHFYIVVNYKNEAIFTQTHLSMHVVPPQENIDKIRPVMDKIEYVLESECGINSLSSNSIETCSKVKCK